MAYEVRIMILMYDMCRDVVIKKQSYNLYMSLPLEEMLESMPISTAHDAV